MNVRIALLALVAGGVLVTPAAAKHYPPPPADLLAKPFTGTSVTKAWIGTWHVVGGNDDGVRWQIMRRKAPACRVYTAGRTSCFLITPPGYDESWAGAITLSKGQVVFRMTYRPRPNSVGCFDDDPYSYRITRGQILITSGMTDSCIWDTSFTFPIRLDRVH